MQEIRLRWFGYIERRNRDDVDKRILRLNITGKRLRGTRGSSKRMSRRT